MHAQNKSLLEYGDLNSQHHVDRHAEENQTEVQPEEVPKLVVQDGPGNLVVVVWSSGKEKIPFECQGMWNHKGKAIEAIKAAEHKLKQQAADDALKIAAAIEAADKKTPSKTTK